jgi:hypothetical protein
MRNPKALALVCVLPSCMRTVGYGLPMVVLVACGGATAVPGGEREAPGDDAGVDAAGDAAFLIIDGTRCCSEGTGTSCCRPNDSWFACAATFACAGAGEPYATKAPCARCCAGLRPIPISRPSPGGDCTVTGTDSRVCAPCGDGVCDTEAGESRCSCRMDCP